MNNDSLVLLALYRLARRHIPAEIDVLAARLFISGRFLDERSLYSALHRLAQMGLIERVQRTCDFDRENAIRLTMSGLAVAAATLAENKQRRRARKPSPRTVRRVHERLQESVAHPYPLFAPMARSRAA